MEPRVRPGGIKIPLARRLAIAIPIAVFVAACQPATTPTLTPPRVVEPTVIPARTPGMPPIDGFTPAPGASTAPAALVFSVQTFPVPEGARPHDVAPASDGGVWYTGQGNGTLGWLEPATGDVHEVNLGAGSAPHGVISGPDGAAWVTDPGLDALVRVAPGTFEVTKHRMPAGARGTGLHTAVFDRDGVLWFTGQRGYVGRFDPATGAAEAFEAPRGAGPYGITVTPSNDVYVAQLQQHYLGAVDRAALSMQVVEPPTERAGPRRAWSDSGGRIWISEWDAGQLGMYDPATEAWREWELPGRGSMAYAIYVDELDAVWLSDFGANAIVRFDPASETFMSFESSSAPANVRQLLGRPGEVWGAESAADQLIVIRYGPG
jgi:virginiamycin B lyase